MKWSWKIGEFAGIGVFVHWTFLLIVIAGLGEHRTPERVGDVMRHDCECVDENAMLEQLFQKMNGETSGTVPVLRRGRLVGLVSVENIGEWLLIHSARRHRPSSRSRNE